MCPTDEAPDDMKKAGDADKDVDGQTAESTRSALLNSFMLAFRWISSLVRNMRNTFLEMDVVVRHKLLFEERFFRNQLHFMYVLKTQYDFTCQESCEIYKSLQKFGRMWHLFEVMYAGFIDTLDRLVRFK